MMLIMTDVRKTFLDCWKEFARVVVQKFPLLGYRFNPNEILKHECVSGVSYKQLDETQGKYDRLFNTQSSQEANAINNEDVQFLRKIIEMVGSLPTAYDDCIKIDDAFTCHIKDNVKSVVDVMISKAYSYVPILDSRNKLVGIFSNGTQLEMRKRDIGIVEELTFEDIVDLVVMKAHEELAVCKNEKFLFVGRNTARSELQAHTSMAKTKEDIIFVTETGDSTEPILGFLTFTDVHNLSHQAD